MIASAIKALFSLFSTTPPKRYVCGFAFSHDLSTVYLMRKNRPEWQKGKLNGVGGRVNRGEDVRNAMCREFMEETGVETYPDDWVNLEWLTNQEVEVTFFTTVLQKNEIPTTMTDEQIWSVYWRNYNAQFCTSSCSWDHLDALPNIPYLVYKAYCFNTSPELERMELQKAQDVR